jgi:hypothetical protein
MREERAAALASVRATKPVSAHAHGPRAPVIRTPRPLPHSFFLFVKKKERDPLLFFFTLF